MIESQLDRDPDISPRYLYGAGGDFAKNTYFYIKTVFYIPYQKELKRFFIYSDG